MVSRETLPLSDNYFEGMTDIFDYMAPSPDGSVLRVSMVKCTENCDSDAHRQLELCWSWAGSGKTSLTNEDLANGFDELVPIMPKGDTVIMAETFMVYEPAFEVGLGTINFDNVVLTRPRFAPQLLYGNEACF